eukprot:m51a1_g13010 hypothetical protein (126) ;mRNA; f:1228-1750
MKESAPQKNFFDISEDELPDPFAPEAQTLQVAKTVPIEQLQIPPEVLQQIFHDPEYSVKPQAVNLQVSIDVKDVDLSCEPRNIVLDVGVKDSETDIVLAGLVGVFFYKHHRKGIHIHRGSLLGDE